MPRETVNIILEGMERRGEIPHAWRETMSWYQKVSLAHQMRGPEAAGLEYKRAQEWGGLPGSEELYAREPGQAPTPLATMGAITGYVQEPGGGWRVGTGPEKVLKRTRLAAQEINLPSYWPKRTSWLRPAGGEPTVGADIPTAFMHGLPAGQGAISSIGPIGQPVIRQVPITPGSQVTALSRPGVFATRGGQLELGRTTQGLIAQRVGDWQRLELTAPPEIVPYSSPTRPEVTQAYKFQMWQSEDPRGGTASVKMHGVKAFVGTGYDPEKMIEPGTLQLLPWAKDVRQQYAGLLGTQYGEEWTRAYAAKTGYELPAGGIEWGGEAREHDPFLMRAGQEFIKEHTGMRTVPLTVHEQALGKFKGGEWAEKTGPYWKQMPAGFRPQMIPGGEGRFRILQEQPVLEAPFLTSYRREFRGDPFVGAEELSFLRRTHPEQEQRLWQEGAERREPFAALFRAQAWTRRGAVTGQRLGEMDWGSIMARGRELWQEELKGSWTGESGRVPGRFLTQAAGEIAPGPIRVPFGKRELMLPGAEQITRLAGAPGPMGETVQPLMSAFRRLMEAGAMSQDPFGTPVEAEGLRGAVRQTWLAGKRLLSRPGVQREVIGTHPTSAWEGPILGHTGLAAGEEIWGNLALERASGARTPEDFQELAAGLREGGPFKGLEGMGWRRPVSDPMGQIGRPGVRLFTEEMASKRGMDVEGLGAGVMTSIWTSFEQRGDTDADRMIRMLQRAVQWSEGKPILERLTTGVARGLGRIRGISEDLMLHAPEETPAGSPLQQIFGSTAKWNEARAWMEEVQKFGNVQDVMDWYGEQGGQVVSQRQLAQSVQRGLEAKEMMGRTYNRLGRELLPHMMGTPEAQSAYRQTFAGPYQRTIDQLSLSPGMRTYLEMQESLSMTPKGRGYGFAKVFSPYSRSEKGVWGPELMKLGGWGEIGTHLTGALMGATEIPEQARAFLIGGQQYHKRVQTMMQEGAQPAGILKMMGEGNVLAGMRAGGPAIQSTMARLKSKQRTGETTYVDYQGKLRTTYMPELAEQPAAARAMAALGQAKRKVLQLFGRRGYRDVPGVEGLLSATPKQFEQALTGISEALTTEQQAVLERAGVSLGLGASEELAALPTQAPAPTTMPEEVAQAPPTAVSPYGPGMAPRQWRAADMPVIDDSGLRAAIAAGGAAPPTGGVPPGGGGRRRAPPPLNFPSGGLPVEEPSGGRRTAEYQGGLREHEHISRGPYGEASRSRWTEERFASQWHVGQLGAVESQMGRHGGGVQAATLGLAGAFTKLQKVVDEGRELRKDEAQEIRVAIKGFKTMRPMVEEWGRQAAKLAALSGSQEYGEQVSRVREGLAPLEAGVTAGRLQEREMEMRLGQMGIARGGPPAPGGIVGLAQRAWGGLGAGVKKAVGGWGMMYLNRMRSMFISPVQQAVGEYAGQQLQAQQAMYGAGLPTGITGAPIDILQSRAQMAQFRGGVGEAGWQAWGGLTGKFGGQNQPLAAGLAIGAPAMGVGLGAAYLFGGPVGWAAGLGTAAVGAAGYLGGAARDREAIGLAQAQWQRQAQGMGLIERAGQFPGWLQENWRGGMGILTQRALPWFLGQGQPGQRAEDIAYGQQIQRGDLGQLVDPEGRMAAMQYFNQQVMAPQLPGMEPAQVGGLTAAYMAMTGQQVTGQFNQQLMVQAGQRAQMLGVQPGAAFQPFQQVAGQFGYGPTAGMAEAISRYALLPQGVSEQARIGGVFAEEAGMGQVPIPQMGERERQQYLFQLQQVAPLARQAQEMLGIQFEPEAFETGGFLERLGAPEMGPTRRRLGQLLGGNQMLWSQIARTRYGKALGIPETVAPSGLRWGTEELWGLQDQMTEAQRAQRDVGLTRQQEQFRWAGEYTLGPGGTAEAPAPGGIWYLEDQMRSLQRGRQEQGFAFQQAGFEQSQRQWQESFGLGRQIFEARVGWQAEDVARQDERRDIQWDWRFEDLARTEQQFDVTSGWRREDLQRGIRFSTGRQRIEAERQLKRFNIQTEWKGEGFDIQRGRMEEQRGWGEEDFDIQKGRNEELIKLQRERFDMQQRHHDEDAKLQADRLKATVEYYQEQKQLEDERIALTRTNWERQREWQGEALTEQEAYNKLVDELMDQQKEITREQQLRVAQAQKILMFADEFLKSADEKLKKMDDYLGGEDTGGLVGLLESAISRHLGRALLLTH